MALFYDFVFDENLKFRVKLISIIQIYFPYTLLSILVLHFLQVTYKLYYTFMALCYQKV